MIVDDVHRDPLQSKQLHFRLGIPSNHDRPRTMTDRVARRPVVVPLQAFTDVVCDPHVVPGRVGITPEDVNGPFFESVHAPPGGTRQARSGPNHFLRNWGSCSGIGPAKRSFCHARRGCRWSKLRWVVRLRPRWSSERQSLPSRSSLKRPKVRGGPPPPPAGLRRDSLRT